MSHVANLSRIRRLGPALAVPALLFLAACTTSPPTITPVVATVDPAAPPTVDPSAMQLNVEVLNTEVAPGPERVAFRIKTPDGTEVTDGQVDVGMYRLLADGQAARTATGAAAFFGAGQPGGGQWVVYTDFDASGTWGFEVTLTHPTLGLGNRRVNVEVSARPLTPKVGDRPTAGDSPTASGGDLAAVTSDPDPDPDLYQMTVGQAMDSGKPTVIYFGSPAHCPTPLCAASLAVLKQVKASYGSQVNFIHVETRDAADPAQLSATTQAWALPSEPWTFVLDKAGRVNTRLEGGLDELELIAVLQQKLGLQ